MAPLYTPEQQARIEIDRQLGAAGWAVQDRAFAAELVPQDRDDEPSGVLLARVRVEREGRAAAGKRERKSSRRLKRGQDAESGEQSRLL